MNIPVIFEDNHLLIVKKPPKILVQADKTGDADMLTLLKQYLKDKYQKPGNVFLGLVHRLDRPVGGIMVFAKTSKAAGRLSDLIRRRNLKKTYLAVIKGAPEGKFAALKDYLQKNESTNIVKVVPQNTPEAMYAELEYEVLQRHNGLALIKVDLITGRPHQIRVQLSHQGYPIYGDVKYGGTTGEEAKTDIALWSYSLTFEHPVKKEEVSFKALPDPNYPWSLFNFKD